MKFFLDSAHVDEIRHALEFWHDDGGIFGGHSIVVRWRDGEPACDYEIAG